MNPINRAKKRSLQKLRLIAWLCVIKIQSKVDAWITRFSFVVGLSDRLSSLLGEWEVAENSDSIFHAHDLACLWIVQINAELILQLHDNFD